MLTCIFCGKGCTSKNSHTNHQRCCPSNPNRNYVSNKLGKRGGNQYTKGTATSLSIESRKKISEANKNRIWDNNKRIRHSESMKRAVEKYPESYTSSNRGRTKQVVYKGVKFQGSWELEFYKWCEENQVAVERCNECFDYEWNGNRKYFPDFYLKDLNIYVEVKGYKTDRDDAKWSQFPKDKLLAIVDKKVLDSIRNRTYNINML